MDLLIGMICTFLLIAMFAGGMLWMFECGADACRPAKTRTVHRAYRDRITIHITDPQEGNCVYCHQPLGEPADVVWVDFEKGQMAHKECCDVRLQRKIEQIRSSV